ncbi:hypothetical protein BH18ACI4_BH18ACI4_14500 [soil metagenome]
MGVRSLFGSNHYIKFGLTIQRQFSLLVEYLLHEIEAGYGHSHSGFKRLLTKRHRTPQPGFKKKEN